MAAFFVATLSSIIDLINYGRTVSQTLSRMSQATYVVTGVSRRVGRLATGVVLNAPQIAGIVAVIIMMLFVYNTLDGIVSILERQQRIREMTAVVRRLEDTSVAAELEIQSLDDSSITAHISFVSPSGEAHTQVVNLRGTRLYFEAKVLNFDYSLIESGSAMNLAIPVAIYSDTVPRSRALPLESTDSHGIPWAYQLPDEEIYGLEVETFQGHVRSLTEYFGDEERARAAGLRTITNQAVAEELAVGSVREVLVQNTGGITIQPIRRTWRTER